MARINLSNGSKSYWFTADEAAEALRHAACNGISYAAIASMMDDDTIARVVLDGEFLSADEFLSAYLKCASEDIIIG